MNGVTLIRALKKMKPEMAFIASSGQGGESRIGELHEIGITNFLSKPYDTEQLLMVLQTALLEGSSLLPKDNRAL
jgi:DNA-binding NtrC family response regulator